MGLSDGDFYNMGEEGTVGFLRHSEIKHGRVAVSLFLFSYMYVYGLTTFHIFV